MVEQRIAQGASSEELTVRLEEEEAINQRWMLVKLSTQMTQVN